MNVSFDDDNVQKTDLSLKDAEKFLVSLKLQIYLKKLENEKQQILSNALKNNIDCSENIKEINNKMNQAREKLELLLDIK